MTFLCHSLCQPESLQLYSGLWASQQARVKAGTSPAPAGGQLCSFSRDLKPWVLDVKPDQVQVTIRCTATPAVLTVSLCSKTQA